MVIGKYRITQRGYVVFGATGVLLILLIVMQVKQLMSPVANENNVGNGTQIQQTQNGSSGNNAAVPANGNVTEVPNANNVGATQETGPGTTLEGLSVEEKNKIMASARCTIYFKPDVYELDEVFYDVLDDIVEMSKRFKESQIIVDGHFNGIPGQKTTAFRTALAQNRAEMVEAYLISQGVDSDRINVNNLGCSVPVNKDESWREIEKNRRVEVYFKTLE